MRYERLTTVILEREIREEQSKLGGNVSGQWYRFVWIGIYAGSIASRVRVRNHETFLFIGIIVPLF